MRGNLSMSCSPPTGPHAATAHANPSVVEARLYSRYSRTIKVVRTAARVEKTYQMSRPGNSLRGGELNQRAPSGRQRPWSQASGEPAVGQFPKPAAVGRPDRFPTQRLQSGPHADVHPQHLADLPGHDRSGALPYGGENAPVVRRQSPLLHAGRAVRDQHHRPAAHLPGRRRGRKHAPRRAAHSPLKNPFSDREFVALGSYLRQQLGQMFFEFVQLRAPGGDPFHQLGIHAPDRGRPPGHSQQEPANRPG